jgi:hypothetical protein
MTIRLRAISAGARLHRGQVDADAQQADRAAPTSVRDTVSRGRLAVEDDLREAGWPVRNTRDNSVVVGNRGRLTLAARSQMLLAPPGAPYEEPQLPDRLQQPAWADATPGVGQCLRVEPGADEAASAAAGADQ